MNKQSSWFASLAGRLPWRRKGGSAWRGLVRRPRAFRSTVTHVEELENRIVPSLLGQHLFPSDYPWNQNISNAPVATNSAGIIAHIGSSIKIHPDWGDDSSANGSSPLYGIPFNVVHGNASGVTRVNVVIDNYPGESDVVPVPIPSNAVIEGDYQNGPNPNGGGYNTGQRGDSHLIVWDEDNNIAYELYGVTRPTDATLFPNTSGVEVAHNDGQWHAAQETVWDMKANSFRSLGNTSADAAGLSILAGLARPDEGLPASQGGQALIDHALRFTLPTADVNPQYIYPASHVVNVSSASTKLPLGSRLRLMNTPAVNSVINTLGLEAQIIARAMQQYGLVLADIGSSLYVSGGSASKDANNQTRFTWDMNDVLGLEALNAGEFQVVDLTPRVTGLSASSSATGATITIIGQNFSGAAGHLAVLFGNSAATSVTFVDDAHLTAVVPNGAGTVDVRVQSGVNATDPNNPSDNVNNPIFGYGLSGISPGDQFTYSGTTVSGTNSLDRFASSGVTSGLADTLTVVVEDTSGKAVNGLTSRAFRFSLSGGTSAGTFGTVTETATPGTYSASFTGTRAGSASTLTATVSGVVLATMPSITVTPGPVSGTTSTVGFASASVASGHTDTLTIVVNDSAGNPITGLSNGAFGLLLSGGISAGSLSAVIETTRQGTYTATFSGTTAGSTSTMTASVNGVILANRPTVQVSAGGVSGANSKVTFASPTVSPGNPDKVTIVVKDSAGNPVSSLTSSAFRFSLSGGTSAGTFGVVTETATKGTYLVTFAGSTAGTPSSVTATVSGVILTTRPTVQVVPRTVSSAKSTAVFASPTVAQGNPDTVTIVVKDGDGRPIRGLTSSAFHVSLSGGSTAGTFGTVTETATKGTYSVAFTGTTPGTTSSLAVSVSGVALTARPQVRVVPVTGR